MKEFFDWFEQSIHDNPQTWVIGVGLFVAFLLGAWVSRKLSRKEKKS